MDPMEMMNPMNAMNQMALRSALGHGSSSSLHHHHHQQRSHHHHHQASALQPFSTPYAVQPSYGHNVFPGISSYSSSVVTMTSDGLGRTRQVYEASSSTRLAPGGVKETKSTVRDSRTGRHEMSIGHHLHDRSHVVKKSKNVYTGHEEQEEDFVNVEEDEEATFENEWQRRAAQSAYRSIGGYGRPSHHQRQPAAITITELPDDEPVRLALPAPPVSLPALTAPSSTVTNGHRQSSDSNRYRMPYYATAATDLQASGHQTASNRLRDPLSVPSSSRPNGRFGAASLNAHVNGSSGLQVPSTSSSTSMRRSASPLDQMRRERRDKGKQRREKPY